MRVLGQLPEALRKLGDGDVYIQSGRSQPLCIYMNVTLPTNVSMEWEPQKNSISEEAMSLS